ncbi:hypothetical protein VISI1226_11866 [Vibrio sinaloensis DSM 21326]|uniref:Uncharacterized protein n=1 Tax=Vibrio sinaloensis DSM 21326 TaxID=945550 RepID=E8M3H2_PHOS4|nr:hypothetical protein VISI1226_11866 [Vibrio sinaloensis DSM 21326]
MLATLPNSLHSITALKCFTTKKSVFYRHSDDVEFVRNIQKMKSDVIKDDAFVQTYCRLFFAAKREITHVGLVPLGQVLVD